MAKDHLNFYLDKDIDPYFSVDKSHRNFLSFNILLTEYYMILNVAVGGKYDNYRSMIMIFVKIEIAQIKIIQMITDF